ncbi:hypothetical protein BHE74_00051515 [Ensete ventricosum]|nr:hypothetical protein BHE74_00051515 [Ensete ventricosum]
MVLTIAPEGALVTQEDASLARASACGSSGPVTVLGLSAEWVSRALSSGPGGVAPNGSVLGFLNNVVTVKGLFADISPQVAAPDKVFDLVLEVTTFLSVVTVFSVEAAVPPFVAPLGVQLHRA